MKLGEFIEKFSHNNMIRLLYKCKGGHEVVESVTSMKQTRDDNFRKELTTLLNKYNKESASNTPDYALAEFLIKCLESYNFVIGLKTKYSNGQVLENDNLVQGDYIPIVESPNELLKGAYSKKPINLDFYSMLEIRGELENGVITTEFTPPIPPKRIDVNIEVTKEGCRFKEYKPAYLDQSKDNLIDGKCYFCGRDWANCICLCKSETV